MRTTIVVLAAALSTPLAFMACKNEADKAGHHNSDSSAAHADHEHSFRCPMHPEVVGKEGDVCPKCGMKLEHMDDAPATNVGYYMNFAMTPASVVPGKPVELSLTPQIKGKEGQAVPLDVEHDKKIHLILVSEDLSWFNHIHPEYQASGNYVVPETFPSPGKYLAFADYKPTGGGHVVDKLPITVQGKPATAKAFTTQKLVGQDGDFSFEMKPTGGKFYSGGTMHIQGVLSQNGKPLDANTLDNYLGAKAHVVVIGATDKEYLHVHPNVENGQFDLHTTFTKPGTYRAWVQFMGGGKVRTIDFTLLVAAGTDADAQKAGATHGGSQGQDHSGH